MLRTVLVLSAVYAVHSSGIGHSHGVPLAAVQEAPVLAASSQYFERTFNRLVVPPVLEPVIPVAPPPPVLIQPAPSAAVPVVPADPTFNPTFNAPVQPNVAIAVATAHAAAPVATILLPPYPFGPPPTIGFIPPSPPINVPDDERKEATTRSTTTAETTSREPEPTTPVPSNSDNNFQVLPSNENTDFRQYYGPPGPPLPLEPPRPRPQKLKTSVEVVPVPLEYISPPPLVQNAPIKAIRHVHTYVPAKIFIRPVSPIRIKKIRRPVRIVAYRAPLNARIGSTIVPQNGRPISRDIEPTTFRPFLRPTTKPPRV